MEPRDRASPHTQTAQTLDASVPSSASSLRHAVFVVQAADGQTQARYDQITAEEPLEIRVHAEWQRTDDAVGSVSSPGASAIAAGRAEERTVSITLRTPQGRTASADSKDADPKDTDSKDAASKDAAADDDLGDAGSPWDAGARADRELAVGYLFSEGLLSCRRDVDAMSRPDPNVVVVRLRAGLRPPWHSLDRFGVTSSACGLCGKRSLDALSADRAPPADPRSSPPDLPPWTAQDIAALPQKLAAAQPIFARTGGLHAAALFDWQGALVAVREDIGRHNAVDKLIGSRLLSQDDPQAPLRLQRHVLLVSGRAGFELVQKARMAGLPLFVAVGAPSSLAVRLAQEAGMTLVAFCRGGQFNVYSGPDRLRLAAARSDDRPKPHESP